MLVGSNSGREWRRLSTVHFLHLVQKADSGDSTPSFSLFTLRLLTRDSLRKTQGQDGSLFLSFKTLSFSTSCRFIPAQGESLFHHASPLKL
jgi:hypothetical protein